MPVNTRLCRQEGSPSRKISEAFLESGACSNEYGETESGLGLQKIKKRSVTTICAMIVAMAAPVTFNAGNWTDPENQKRIQNDVDNKSYAGRKKGGMTISDSSKQSGKYLI